MLTVSLVDFVASVLALIAAALHLLSKKSFSWKGYRVNQVGPDGAGFGWQ